MEKCKMSVSNDAYDMDDWLDDEAEYCDDILDLEASYFD